jgi:methionyl-tRNA formyltransferase
MTHKARTKIIFIGTPDFGLPSLRALAAEPDFKLVAVITQPDRPVGRSQKTVPPAIKQEALQLDLKVLQPEKIREITEEIKKMAPDIIVVVAYAQIVPEEILSLPRFGCINIHGSLLPKYRGASVIQAAIMNGDRETGVTVMKMDKTLDTGPIIYQAKTLIAPTETAETLSDKLSKIGGEVIVPTLKAYISGKLKPVPQDAKLASYVSILKKTDGQLDWNKPAEELERQIRAMHPWPGSFAKIKESGEILKISKAAPHFFELNDQPVGKIFHYKNKLAVQTGRDTLIIERLQLAGKKEISADEFLNGHREILGATLI